MQVHVDRGGERYGPYSLEDVNAYLTNGTLLPTDQAWQDGMPDWVPITQIPGVTMPGEAAAPPAPAAGAACPQCQAPVDATQVICMGCGTRLQGETAAAKGGSKKALFISLGVAGVIGLAVGSYFLFFNKADGGEQAKGNITGEANATAPKALKMETPEDLAKHTFEAFAASDFAAFQKLTLTGLGKDNVKQILIKYQFDNDSEKMEEKFGGDFEKFFSEKTTKQEEDFRDVIEGATERDKINWSEVKFVSVDTSDIKKKGLAEVGDLDVFLSHKGVEYRIILDDCLNTTEHGWLMADEPRWRGRENQRNDPSTGLPVVSGGFGGGQGGSGGFQPIHQAAEEGDLEAIKQHLRAGQNINLQMGKDGETPLHRAITRGQVEAVRLLINNGANVNIGRGKDGKTPLDLAVSRGEASIAKLLHGKGATGGGRPGGGFAGGFPGGQGGGKTRPGGSGGGGFSLERFDRDKDGRIGKSEVPQFMARMFDQLDSNKDGFIDQVEINAMRQNFPQGGGRPSGGGFQGGKTRPGGFGGKGGGQTRPGGFGGGQRPGGGFGGKALPGKEEGGTGQCPYCKKIFPAPNLPFHVRKCPKNSGDQIRPGGFGGRPRSGGQGGGKAPEGVIGGQSGPGGIIPQPR